MIEADKILAMQHIAKKFAIRLLFLPLILLSAVACSNAAILPTLAAPALIPQANTEFAVISNNVPPTFTPAAVVTIDPSLNYNDSSPLQPTLTPSLTPIFPSKTPTPSRTPTPTNTPTETPIPPEPISGSTFRPHIIGNGNRSKLGVHVVQNNDPKIMEFVRQARPAVMKGVDDLGFLIEVKEISPRTITIGRLSGPVFYSGNPEEEARKYVQEFLPRYRLNHGVDFWEGFNEPDPNLEHMSWYARFEAERVREMARHGLRTAVGGFATGVPEMNEFELFLPAIEAAIQHHGILTLHEYSAPVMTNGYGDNLPGYPAYPDRGSLTFRYRWYYREFLEPRGLVIPLVITEAGIDGIIGNRPGPSGIGWSDFQDYSIANGWGADGPEAFINQLAWYDKGTRQDEYVLGFTIFTAGGIGQWKAYDIGPILPNITNYVRSQD